MDSFFVPTFRLKRTFLVFVLVAVCLWALPAGNYAADQPSGQDKEPVNILFLDSYSPAMPWSQAFLKGLVSAQKKSERPIELSVEYLDKARMPDG